MDAKLVYLAKTLSRTKRKDYENYVAGINVLGLINEPTAAALAFGMSRDNEGSTIMFYDLGYGKQ